VTTASGAPRKPASDNRGGLRGRGGLLVPLVLGTISTLVVIGMLQMDLSEEATFPGPRFFPTILAVAGYLLTVLLTVHYLKHHDPESEQTEYRTYSDWQAFGWVAGGFLAFAVLLEVLGWILGAGLLFWCVARGFGSQRPGFDVSVALLMSSGTYLIFGTALGLPLPSGVLGGL
jgi:putative tricarboxylic transport membrane protein